MLSIRTCFDINRYAVMMGVYIFNTVSPADISTTSHCDWRAPTGDRREDKCDKPNPSVWLVWSLNIKKQMNVNLRLYL